MSTLDPKRLASLLLVTGEGAHRAVADLVNHLDAVPHVRKSHVAAAARVGQQALDPLSRQWRHGRTAGDGSGEGACDDCKARSFSKGSSSKGIKAIDLRLPGEMIVELAAPVAPERDVKKFKVSQQQ